MVVVGWGMTYRIVSERLALSPDAKYLLAGC
jgi:hypothetical protein